MTSHQHQRPHVLNVNHRTVHITCGAVNANLYHSGQRAQWCFCTACYRFPLGYFEKPVVCRIRTQLTQANHINHRPHDQFSVMAQDDSLKRHTQRYRLLLLRSILTLSMETMVGLKVASSLASNHASTSSTRCCSAKKAVSRDLTLTNLRPNASKLFSEDQVSIGGRISSSLTGEV